MIFEHIINLIAPHHCLECNKEGSLLCDPCTQSLKPAIQRCYLCQQPSSGGITCMQCLPQTPVKCVRSLVRYEGGAKNLLWKLKSDRAQAAARIIGQHCSVLVGKPESAIITYIPTAPIRVRQRGYDQARLIARAVAQYSDLPVAPLLARTSNSRQVGASRQARHRQLRYAYRLRNEYMAKDRTIILIDDVITTGSSIRAASEVLAQAGAKSVLAITFAQA